MERHAGAGRGNGRVFRKHARALLSRVPESKIWKKARTRSSGWQTRPWITRPAFVSARPLQGRTRDEEPKIFSRQETRALAGTQRAFECRLRARQKRLEMLSSSYNCNSCSARIKLSLSMSDCASLAFDADQLQRNHRLFLLAAIPFPFLRSGSRQLLELNDCNLLWFGLLLGYFPDFLTESALKFEIDRNLCFL